MNILAIGNSFSQDAAKYLHDIAKAEGIKLNIANLYIPACSLEMHYENMLSGAKNSELQYNGQDTGFYVSLQEAVTNRTWDIVTLQQVSSLSFKKESFSPYIFALRDFVKQQLPDARIFLHETWAYEDGSEHLQNAGYCSHAKMLEDIKKAYAHIARELLPDGVIPSGDMFGFMQENGIEKIHRDGLHATLGLGRYALGLLWFRLLCGKKPSEKAYESLGQRERSIVKSFINSIE